MSSSQYPSDMRMVWRNDPAYETFRQNLWNQLVPDRFPEVIVSPSSADDVVHAIDLARSRGLTVTTQTGGHTWCSPSLRDGGMLIELSQLNGLAIDAEARTATVQPNIKSRSFALALASEGLAFSTGHCSRASLAGFLLSGGVGWNAGAWGPSTSSVEEIEIVLADGTVVRASEDENSDLFWAARGGGSGFFGVVTRFRLRLEALPKAITVSTYRYPLAYVDEVAEWASKIAPALPTQVEMFLCLSGVPPELVSALGEKIITVEAVAFANSPEEAERWLAVLETCPFRQHAVMREDRKPSSWVALYDATDDLWPEHRRNAAEMPWCDEDYTRTLPLLAPHIDRAPSRESHIIGWINPRAGSSRLPDMAFSMWRRQVVPMYAIWQDPTDDAANLTWLREARETIGSRIVGNYLGESDLLAAPDRARRSFGEAQWQRLKILRQRYDPEGVFHNFLGVVG